MIVHISTWISSENPGETAEIEMIGLRFLQSICMQIETLIRLLVLQYHSLVLSNIPPNYRLVICLVTSKLDANSVFSLASGDVFS